MGVANTAVLLAKWRMKVLIVDWDLEAPGIEAYFITSDEALPEHRKIKPGVIDLVKAIEDGNKLDWRDGILQVRPLPEGEPISLLLAGKDDGKYMTRVQHTNWDALFQKESLGDYIEELRNEWKRAFDFILIDSRTGITDIGGICTIHFPDYLLAWFTTNRSSMNGVKYVAERARLAQDTLPFDRNQLLVLPVPSRDESRTELKKADEWKVIIEREFGDFYKEWLPSQIEPVSVIEKLRIPYIPYWSFGECLPVVEEGTSDPSSIGWTYEILSRLIFFHFQWQDIEKDPETSIEYLRKAIEVNLPSFGPEYAKLLLEKASNLHEEEQTSEAIGVAREAVKVWQDLSEIDLSNYGRDLVKAKDLLSVLLKEENDIQASITEATEAVNVCRRLYEKDPIGFGEELASALIGFSDRLYQSEDTGRAVETLRELINIQRSLALENPARFEGDLAAGLFNLTNYLVEINQPNDALTAAQETVDTYRHLIGVNGKRYEPDLASSLNTLSECLILVGDIKGALEAAREAMEIFSRLAQETPTRYEPDLASSLNAVLDPLSQLTTDEIPDALLLVQTAVETFKRLAGKDPKRYEPDLAKSLNMLPDLLAEKDDLQGALAVQKEVTEIFRRLMKSNLSLYGPELARSLISLSKLLFKLDDSTAGKEAAKEGLEILEGLSPDSPTRYKEEFEEASNLINK